MIEDYWSFTSTKMLPHEDQYVPYPFVDEDPSRQAFRSPAACLYKGNGLIKLNFTKIAIVSNDKYIAGNASRYFKDYVFKVNNFPDYWEVVQFESMDELFRGVQRNETQEYCFGLNFDSNFTYNASKEDPNAQYHLDIQFSFNKGMVVDTNSPPYNEHVMSPDIASWGNW